MKAKIRLIHVLVAFSLILALVGAPISAQTSTDPQAPTAPESSEKGGTTWEQLPPEIQAKVDPRILQELNGEIVPAHLGGSSEQTAVAPEARQPIDKTRFIVYLKDQTDLKAVTARPFATTVAQRNAVVDALIATAQQEQAPVKALLAARQTTGDVAGYYPYYIFNGLAVEGDLDTVIELAKRDDVARIAANYPLVKFETPQFTAAPAPAQALGGLDPANWNIDLVDAERAWYELGINGAGVVVADFDTGVDWTHPALRPKYRGWNGTSANHNYNWFEFNAGSTANWDPNGNYGASATTVPYDCDGHGTHTMGTMVGDGGTSTTHVGMAPGAKWIASPGICGTTMPGGYGDSIGGIRTFQWMMCPTDLTGNLSTRNCAMAPDVINNSWGSSNPADDTFRPVIQALRAAGIAPVFAAGNPSAGPGSIGSPGAAPEGITVGATDIDDNVASFSGRGPSFYEGEQKPELSAPGVNVNSTIPGGGYSGPTWSGTSMAAPAVSGLVALIVSADLQDGHRDLNVDEIEQFMEHTAVDLGPTGPDDDFGFGRIDAYNAVRWALSAGDLRGIVRDANTSAPIAGATISGVKTPDTFTTHSAANGTYSTTVPGGLYNVAVSAFGYNPGAFAGVGVITSTSSVVDFNLTPLPTAILTGTVVSGTTPINGALVYVDAKPSLSFTTGADGAYTLTLPVGTHALTAKATGYRIKHQNVTVASGGSTQNIAMTPAPTILLVEADAYKGWFFGRPAHNFFKWSLDKQDYLYDEATITSTAILPTLTGYNVVIWFHTGNTSTAYPGTSAATLLQNYLNSGGRLIFSGENASGATSFRQNYLHADVLSTNAAGAGVQVTGIGFLSGLNLTLNESALYSYPNNSGSSLAPDAVTPRDGSAYPVMTYDNGAGPAVLAVDPCAQPYRAVYFAVGYENLGPRAYSRPQAYADLLDRSIQWVTGSKLPYDVTASVVPGSRIDQPGVSVNYNLTIVNTGVNTDTYDVPLAGNVWPTQVLSGTTPVTQTMPVAPCSAQSLTVRVNIPASAPAGASDTFTVTATSQTAPGVTSQASAKTTAFPLWKIEAPMPTPRYRLGATALPGTPYYFAIGGQGGASFGVPMDANERYNACANSWDVMAPMPTALGNIGVAEINGKIYVPGGYSGGTAFDILQIYDVATDSWSTGASLPDTLWGAGVAAYGGKLYTFGGEISSGTTDKTFEYDPTTNTWTEKSPMPGGSRSSMATAVLNGKIYVAGGWSSLNLVEVYDPATDTWSAAAAMNVGRQSPGLAAASDGYLYVSGGGNGWTGLTSAERYNPTTDTWTIIPSLNSADRAGSASAFVAGRVFAVGGVSGGLSNVNESLKLTDAFCLSNKQAQQATVQPGGRITYTVNLLSNPTALASAHVLDPTPAGTTFGGFGPATVSPAPTFNSGQNRVEWTGAIPGGQAPVTFTFGVVVNPAGWVSKQMITNTATFSDGISLNFNKTAVTTLDFFDLSRSTKNVDKAVAVAGEVLTYTVHVENASTQNGAFTLTDPIPANASYASGSLTYPTGSAGYAAGVITWTGQLPWTYSYTNVSSSYEYADNPFTAGTAALSPIAQLAWEDMTDATLIPLSNADDSVNGPFPLGFSFPWFGGTRTQFWVDTNGRVHFAAGASGTSYTTCATTNDALSFYDGDRQVNGSVRYKQFGDHTTIQYLGIGPYASASQMDVQIVLYTSGFVKLQYQNQTGALSGGVQLRGPTGTTTVYGCPATFNTDRGVGFLAPGATAQIFIQKADLTFAVTTTAPLLANTWITNTATITDSRNVVYQRSASTLINGVDLSTSYKIANRAEAKVGDPVNYAVWLINTGQYTATGASLSDPIPASTTWNGIAPTCTVGTCGIASNVITWTGNITPGGAVVVSFGVTYTTPLMDRTPVTNTATINDGLGNVLTRQTAFLARTPNLSAASKTVNAAVAQPGGVVTYTVYVHNSGGADGNAQLVDPIPAELTYVPGSLIFGSGSGGYAGGVITWTGSVPAASQIPVQFRATVDPAAVDGTVINNTATITDVTWNTSYQRSAAFTVRRIADLFVNKVGPGVAGSGATLVYTITYGNAGPNATPGAVNVVDTLPTNATFVSASSGGVYSSTARTVTWNVGSLASGVSGTLSLVLSANSNLPALTVLTNTATIDAIPQDDNLANNTSQAFTVIGSNVNLLTSSKTVDKSSVSQGGTVTYTITLANTGNVTSTVTITDPIPTGAAYVLGSSTLNAVSTSLYNDTANRIEWQGVVPAGGTVTIRFQAVISAVGGTSVTNVVTINDGAGMTFTRQAVTQSIRYTVYLPAIMRQ